MDFARAYVAARRERSRLASWRATSNKVSRALALDRRRGLTAKAGVRGKLADRLGIGRPADSQMFEQHLGVRRSVAANAARLFAKQLIHETPTADDRKWPWRPISSCGGFFNEVFWILFDGPGLGDVISLKNNHRRAPISFGIALSVTLPMVIDYPDSPWNVGMPREVSS